MRGPDEVRASLRALAHVDGTVSDAFFGMLLSKVVDPAELERRRIRRHVMLAKYAHQPIRDLWEMPSRLVKRYVTELVRLFEEEHEDMQRRIAAASAAAQAKE